MENNEVMKKMDEVRDLEPVTEFAENKDDSKLGVAIGAGLAMVAGGLLTEFVVKPTVSKLINWHKSRKAKKEQADDIVDGVAEEIDEDE